MKVVVTGSAGFIGFHLCNRLLHEGFSVSGIDNFNSYYDPKLKFDRIKKLLPYKHFKNYTVDIVDKKALFDIFDQIAPEYVVHLAAQPGVRYSIKNPQAYIDSNIQGFINVLEAARHYHTKHLVFASSSSVYGANTRIPFSVHDNVDHPMSLYAATKKANELMAHTYSSLYGIPVTGLRFFTVYGPWGRPDMALFLFTRAIFENRPIDVFNNGDMLRDFTYIDDIVEGVFRLIEHIPAPNPDWSGANPDPGSSYAPYKIYNIGNNNPLSLLEYIRMIEKSTGRKARLNFLPMQPGDVYKTYADIEDLRQAVNYQPATPVQEGIDRFVHWYKKYYGIE